MKENFHNKNIGSLYNAMNSGIKRLGVINSNIENVNTIGYKSINPDSVLFSDVLKGAFRDEEQGDLMKTNEKLDLALDKSNAYFLVEGENGPEKVRDGRFHINEEGKVVNVEGKELVILDTNGEGLDLHKVEEYTINQKGEIYISNNFLGRIPVHYEGNVRPGEEAKILQGHLESSNVDLSQNIVSIMQTRRHIDTLQNILAMEMVIDKSLLESYGRNV